MDCNISLLNNSNIEQLTKQNVLDEYYNLQVQYRIQMAELENLRQENYRYKSSITVLENTKTDIENENEQLHTDNKVLVNKLKVFEDQISNLTKQNELIVNSNSETYEQQQTIITKLKLELEKSQKNITVSNLENDELMKENEKLKEELVHVKSEVQCFDNIEEMKLIIEQNDTELMEFRCKNSVLNNEITEIKRILENKNQQLADINNLKESLQEEIAALRVELDLSRATTANAHSNKGNSLFGEVYDSRQHLQKKLSLLKKHYLEMKSKYTLKISENQKLSNENVILCKQWQDEIENQSDIEYAWKGAHEQTIESLKENITFLKNEIIHLKKIATPKVPVTEKWISDNLKDLFERNKELVIKSEEKLNKKIFNDLITNERLHFIERELCKWKSEATKYEIERNNLKLEIDRLKSQSNLITEGPITNESQELVELLSNIENKENLSTLSNTSLLSNISIEQEEKCCVDNITKRYTKQRLQDNFSKIKLEESIVEIKLEETNQACCIQLEEKENLLDGKDALLSSNTNIYYTPEPPRILKARKKRFVKSVSENLK